ncbi:hypothetical protein KCP78_09715 [Salmonella enterica subsp. enterica]|nr:hypothetical protein KCP78_09715 [Salmonella enterica subsp. enterica]
MLFTLPDGALRYRGALQASRPARNGPRTAPSSSSRYEPERTSIKSAVFFPDFRAVVLLAEYIDGLVFTQQFHLALMVTLAVPPPLPSAYGAVMVHLH